MSFFFFKACLDVFWEAAEECLDWVYCFPLLSPRSSDPCAKFMSSATGKRVCLSTPENCPLWPTAPADLLCVNVFSHGKKWTFHVHVCLTWKLWLLVSEIFLNKVLCHTWLKDSVVIYSLWASKPLWLSFCEDCNSIWV